MYGINPLGGGPKPPSLSPLLHPSHRCPPQASPPTLTPAVLSDSLLAQPIFLPSHLCYHLPCLSEPLARLGPDEPAGGLGQLDLLPGGVHSRPVNSQGAEGGCKGQSLGSEQQQQQQQQRGAASAPRRRARTLEAVAVPEVCAKWDGEQERATTRSSSVPELRARLLLMLLL